MTIAQEARDGLRDQLAIQLVRYWTPITGEANPPEARLAQIRTDARRMADELITTRQTSIRDIPNRDNRVLNIDQVRGQLSRLQARFNGQLPFNISLLDEIPSSQVAEQFGQAIERGAARAETPGFMATIMNYIGGFFEWVFSGFKDGFAGLKASIGRRYEETAVSSVRQELAGVPALNALLTPERLGQIDAMVRSRVRDHATGQTAEQRGETATSQETLDTTRPLPNGGMPSPQQVRDIVEHHIRGIVHTSMHTPGPAGTNGRSTPSAWERLTANPILSLGDGAGLSTTEATAVENALSQAFINVAADPNYRHENRRVSEMNDTQLRTALRDQLRERLTPLSQTWILGTRAIILDRIVNNTVPETDSPNGLAERLRQIRDVSSMAQQTGYHISLNNLEQMLSLVSNGQNTQHGAALTQHGLTNNPPPRPQTRSPG